MVYPSTVRVSKRLVIVFGNKVWLLECSLGESLNRGLQLINWARYKWEKEITEKDYKFLLEMAKKLKVATEEIIED